MCSKGITLSQQPTQDYQWKFFCSSSNFLYVVILLKNEKMDLGVTTFWKHTHVWEFLGTHSHTKLAKE
jgi:hypothetical protein